jgi:hypothetical protein
MKLKTLTSIIFSLFLSETALADDDGASNPSRQVEVKRDSTPVAFTLGQASLKAGLVLKTLDKDAVSLEAGTKSIKSKLGKGSLVEILKKMSPELAVDLISNAKKAMLDHKTIMDTADAEIKKLNKILGVLSKEEKLNHYQKTQEVSIKRSVVDLEAKIESVQKTFNSDGQGVEIVTLSTVPDVIIRANEAATAELKELHMSAASLKPDRESLKSDLGKGSLEKLLKKMSIDQAIDLANNAKKSLSDFKTIMKEAFAERDKLRASLESLSEQNGDSAVVSAMKELAIKSISEVDAKIKSMQDKFFSDGLGVKLEILAQVPEEDSEAPNVEELVKKYIESITSPSDASSDTDDGAFTEQWNKNNIKALNELVAAGSLPKLSSDEEAAIYALVPTTFTFSTPVSTKQVDAVKSYSAEELKAFVSDLSKQPVDVQAEYFENSEFKAAFQENMLGSSAENLGDEIEVLKSIGESAQQNKFVNDMLSSIQSGINEKLNVSIVKINDELSKGTLSKEGLKDIVDSYVEWLDKDKALKREHGGLIVKPAKLELSLESKVLLSLSESMMEIESESPTDEDLKFDFKQDASILLAKLESDANKRDKENLGRVAATRAEVVEALKKAALFLPEKYADVLETIYKDDGKVTPPSRTKKLISVTFTPESIEDEEVTEKRKFEELLTGKGEVGKEGSYADVMSEALKPVQILQHDLNVYKDFLDSKGFFLANLLSLPDDERARMLTYIKKDPAVLASDLNRDISAQTDVLMKDKEVINKIPKDDRTPEQVQDLSSIKKAGETSMSTMGELNTRTSEVFGSTKGKIELALMQKAAEMLEKDPSATDVDIVNEYYNETVPELRRTIDNLSLTDLPTTMDMEQRDARKADIEKLSALQSMQLAGEIPEMDPTMQNEVVATIKHYLDYQLAIVNHTYDEGVGQAAEGYGSSTIDNIKTRAKGDIESYFSKDLLPQLEVLHEKSVSSTLSPSEKIMYDTYYKQLVEIKVSGIEFKAKANRSAFSDSIAVAMSDMPSVFDPAELKLIDTANKLDQTKPIKRSKDETPFQKVIHDSYDELISKYREYVKDSFTPGNSSAHTQDLLILNDKIEKIGAALVELQPSASESSPESEQIHLKNVASDFRSLIERRKRISKDEIPYQDIYKELTITVITLDNVKILTTSTSNAGEKEGAAYQELLTAGNDDIATKGLTGTQAEDAKSLDAITTLMQKIAEDLEPKKGDADKAFTGTEAGEVDSILEQAKNIETEVQGYKEGNYAGIVTATTGISDSAGAATVDLSVTTDTSTLSGYASTAAGDLDTIAGAEDAEQKAKVDLINALGEQESSANDASAAAGEIFSDVDLFTIELDKNKNKEAAKKVTVETLNKLKDLVRSYKSGMTKTEQEAFDKKVGVNLKLAATEAGAKTKLGEAADDESTFADTQGSGDSDTGTDGGGHNGPVGVTPPPEHDPGPDPDPVEDGE